MKASKGVKRRGRKSARQTLAKLAAGEMTEPRTWEELITAMDALGQIVRALYGPQLRAMFRRRCEMNHSPHVGELMTKPDKT